MLNEYIFATVTFYLFLFEYYYRDEKEKGPQSGPSDEGVVGSS